VNKIVMLGLSAAALVTQGCATTDAARAEPAAAAATPANRYVHNPDLGSLIKRFLSPQGFMDPGFPPTVARPSRYLTDFYGVQALKDVSRVRILSDFVPSAAEKIAEDENSVTLRFAKGYTARFFPNSSLSVVGQTTPVSHVEISGETWQELGANLADFRGRLAAAKLEDAYLIPNKFYADEVTTYDQMTKGKAAPITVDADGKAIKASRDGVLLLPEGVHGRPEDVTLAIETIRAGKFDWIGMEMIGTDQQPIFDAFNRAKKGTPAYAEARAKVVAYFAEAWNGRAGPKTTGEENLYFKLVEAAHDAGVRVIGIEASSLDYLLFRYGETQFGAAVRNLWWAQATPPTGRGIIFGGGAHFNLAQPVNIQDFLQVQRPGRPMFSLKPIVKKTPA